MGKPWTCYWCLLVASVLALCLVAVADVSPANGTEAKRRTESTGRSNEERLIRHVVTLLPETVSMYRPNMDSDDAIRVTFDISLIHILDFDEKRQRLTTQIWQSITWIDQSVSWNKADFGQKRAIGVSQDSVWKPDVMLYNSFGKTQPVSSESKITVYHDGTMFWMPLSIFDSTCEVDLVHFPYDSQICKLEFASWNYDASVLDITSSNNFTSIDLDQYINNLEWNLTKVSVNKTFEKFKCCPEKFALVTYHLHLRRNYVYYARVMLLPVIVLSVMSVFVFCIPAQRPDRTGVGLGLFTSFMLFLLLVVSISPPSADSKLANYLTVCVGIMTSIVITSIFFIHITSWRGKVPGCLKKLVLVKMFQCLFPLTHRHIKEGHIPSNGTSNISEWVTFVTVMDRLMFLLYSIVLLVSFLVFFPMKQLENSVI